jgi:Flp pilus assembly protein protease CpaA
MDIYQTTLFILLGLFSSYQDIKKKKISNFLVFFSFILTLIFSKHNIKQYSFFALAFAIGIAFWYFNLWSAADGKLFSLYALLIPLQEAPFYLILASTFSIALIYIILTSKIKPIKQLFQPLASFEWWLRSSLAIFSLTFLAKFLLASFNIDQFLMIILIVAFTLFVKDSKLVLIGMILISILRIIFDNQLLEVFTWTVFFSILLSLAFVTLLINHTDSEGDVAFAPFLFLGSIIAMYLPINFL